MKKVHLLIILLCLVSLFPVANYFINQRVKLVEKQKRDLIKQDLVYWEKVASDSPTYRDAYLQLALGNLQLEEIEIAKANLKKVYEVDPNWQVPASLSGFLPPLLPELR